MAASVFPFQHQARVQQNIGPVNIVDPSSNNSPLDFNKSAVPLMELKLNTSPVDQTQRKDINPVLGGVQGDPAMAAFGAMESWTNPQTSWGSMGQMGMAGFQGDPNMMNQWQMGGQIPAQMGAQMMGQMGGFAMVPPPPPPDMQQKEIIQCKSCILFPPMIGMPPPTTRERPPGCRTVFVGGLPQNITEEIVREIFERCGGITNIRLSKKNFCHIRFENMFCVDGAIYLSGYKVRIGTETDPPNMGRLHVDFAQARDDLYEWECYQRQLQREERHRQRMEEQRLRPPSPQPVVHFSDHEAAVMAEQLKAGETGAGDSSFAAALVTLATWLERGDCNKRTANTFFSMIQTTHSHVRRLMNDKQRYNEELEQAKELHRQNLNGIIVQFSEIEQVLTAACKQKARDHFSKAQRKHIDQWKQQTQEIKITEQQDLLRNRNEIDMEVSDSEENEQPPDPKKQKIVEVFVPNTAELDQLKEENDSLRCQLEAYKNEVLILKGEYNKHSDGKETQIKALQHACQGLQQQLLAARSEAIAVKATEPEVEKKVEKPGALMMWLKKAVVEKESPTKDDKISVGEGDEDEKDAGTENKDEAQTEETEGEKVALPTFSQEAQLSEKSEKFKKATEKEALLVGLLATFLHVHPFGASVEYLWAYISRLDSKVSPADIESLMIKLPTVFKQELFGVGATLEKRWQFCGFETCLKKKP
ncbi:ecto-NOX disulfide-thiol exchanger 1-like [Saccoglossus kowalevskii]|uniref:Ecto-NOX disulfide-thiol exchanger 2-like n=1 Tax=Saccoglossus kowalevskii TaxID=10224 RepID=A0ABM0MSG2_SACKO|nr:PREDICTED: ecto-NOX disulfide-thiol exchanger 2-like [Saccoglossus kowalevskii]